MKNTTIELETLIQIKEGQLGFEKIDIGFAGKTPVKMTVKKSLSTEDFFSFVRAMSGSQWTGDTYSPEYGEILFDILLIQKYTNATLPTVGTGETAITDSIEAYELIHALGLKEKVLSVVKNTEQYQSLLECIFEAQGYELSRRTGVDGIAKKIKDFVGGIDTNKILEKVLQNNPDIFNKLDDLPSLAKAIMSETSPEVKMPDNVVSFENLGGFKK